MAKTPQFQHRHYKLIAGAFAEARKSGFSTPERLGALDDLIDHFADELRGTNPNFSRDRFISAAKGELCNGRDKVR